VQNLNVVAAADGYGCFIAFGITILPFLRNLNLVNNNRSKGAFTLGVRDSRVESPNTMPAI
jgi:hypothetical protein